MIPVEAKTHFFITDIYLDPFKDIDLEGILSDFKTGLEEEFSRVRLTKRFDEPDYAIVGYRLILDVPQHECTTFNHFIKTKTGKNIKIGEYVREYWGEILASHQYQPDHHEQLMAHTYHGLYSSYESENSTQMLLDDIILRPTLETSFFSAAIYPIFSSITLRNPGQAIDLIHVSMINDVTGESAILTCVRDIIRENLGFISYFRHPKNLADFDAGDFSIDYSFIVIRPIKSSRHPKRYVDLLHTKLSSVGSVSTILYHRKISDGIDNDQPYSKNTARIIERIGLIEDGINNRHLINYGYRSRLSPCLYTYDKPAGG